ERAVAAAGYDDILAAEILDPAHGVVHRPTLIVLDALQGRALGGEGAAAGGDHHDLCVELGAGVGLEPERSVLQLLERVDALLEMEYGIERLDLLEKTLGQFLARHHGQSRDVVNRLLGIELGALSAGLVEDVDQVRLDVE